MHALCPFPPPLLLNPAHGFLAENPTILAKLFAMGALFAAFLIGQFIGAPVIGELADRFGRKKLFIRTISLTMIGYFLTGLSMSLKSILLIFLIRFLTGLFSGNQGLCNASIADLSPSEKERAKKYGILTVVWGISFPISLIMGGIFSDPALSKYFSPEVPFYLVVILTAFTLLAVIFFYPETFVPSEEKFSFSLLRGYKNIQEAILRRVQGNTFS